LTVENEEISFYLTTSVELAGVEEHDILDPVIEPPTLRLPEIPTPPETIRAPVVEDDEAVVFITLTTSPTRPLTRQY